MIKKIICPTDFSNAANNAVEYAAKMAAFLGAKLLLLNVQQITLAASAVSMGEGIGAQARKNSQSALALLKTESAEINKKFKIDSSYEVDVSMKSLQNVLSEFSTGRNLIIMGTNGSDSIYDYFFGTRSRRVIEKAHCPVLLIPDVASFKRVSKIVLCLEDGIKKNILNKRSRKLKLEASAVFGKNESLKFEQFQINEFSVDGFRRLKMPKSGLLALAYDGGGAVRSMIETADFPMLIFPS